jgi:hypothetical protein
MAKMELIYWDKTIAENSTKSFFRQKIQEILESAPSDSSLCSCIYREDNKVKGLLRIFCSKGQFGVTASSREVHHLVAMLYTKMKKQLVDWVRSRHFNDITATCRFPKLEAHIKNCEKSEGCPFSNHFQGNIEQNFELISKAV